MTMLKYAGDGSAPGSVLVGDSQYSSEHSCEPPKRLSTCYLTLKTVSGSDNVAFDTMQDIPQEDFNF